LRRASLSWGVIAVVVALGVGAAGAAPIIVSTTQTEVTIGGLTCGTQYRVRVNVAGNSTVATLNPVTKPCPPPQPPPPPPSPDSTLYAKSGFEANAALSPRSTTTWNQWQWLSGVDQLTGFDWTPAKLWGSPWPWGVLDVVCSSTGSCPGSGLPRDYVTSSIETVAAYNGQLTRALKLHSVKPNPNACCQQAGFGNSQLSQSSSASRTYYMRARWKFNPDIQAQADSLGTGYWRQVWVFKTPNYNRIDIKLLNDDPGGLTWQIQSDNCGANPIDGCSTVKYWAHDSIIKLPTTTWFTIEIAYKRAADSSGRFFFAANGQVILDRNGPNLPREEEVNNIAHAIVYASKKLPGYVLVDDLEVRSAPPCAALPCGAG
jgi:hypothetical protein